MRHFKHNSRVRNRAEELYSKIKSLYVIGEVRPNPKLNGKHKPQSIIRKINEAAAAKVSKCSTYSQTCLFRTPWDPKNCPGYRGVFISQVHLYTLVTFILQWDHNCLSLL